MHSNDCNILLHNNPPSRPPPLCSLSLSPAVGTTSAPTAPPPSPPVWRASRRCSRSTSGAADPPPPRSALASPRPPPGLPCSLRVGGRASAGRVLPAAAGRPVSRPAPSPLLSPRPPPAPWASAGAAAAAASPLTPPLLAAPTAESRPQASLPRPERPARRFPSAAQSISLPAPEYRPVDIGRPECPE